MKNPSPIRAAGWISIPVTDRATAASTRGSSGHAGVVQGVGDTMGEQGVHPGPRRQHLERADPGGRRIPALGDRDVAPDLRRGALDQAEAGHAIKG